MRHSSSAGVLLVHISNKWSSWQTDSKGGNELGVSRLHSVGLSQQEIIFQLQFSYGDTSLSAAPQRAVIYQAESLYPWLLCFQDSSSQFIDFVLDCQLATSGITLILCCRSSLNTLGAVPPVSALYRFFIQHKKTYPKDNIVMLSSIACPATAPQ